MSEKLSLKNSPILSFLPTQYLTEGVEVREIDLSSSISPLPPFNTSRFTVAPGCCSVTESHHEHEIWIIAQGAGKLCYDQREMRINQDDFVYLEPNTDHQVINDNSKMMVVFSIWWK